MMNYFKQIYYEMKHQKMMTWVSISGTALAIFLMMAFIMSEHIYEVESAPESNRTRILYGEGCHTTEGESDDNSSSAMGLSYDFAQRIYGDIEGVEALSYIIDPNWSNTNVNAPGGEVRTVPGMQADANIWSIYDFKFIYGRPYDAAEAAADSIRVVVITQSLARSLFNEENALGRTIEITTYPYTVIGVIEDTKPILPKSYVSVIRPLNPSNTWSDMMWGPINVVMLAKDKESIPAIKAEVEHRYERMDLELKKGNHNLKYHGQPYTSREMGADFGSNNGPDMDSHDTMMLILFALLIILPAINLSSMTRSRLRHRIAEIGVRRAFGARRRSIISQILCENFIITLIGGTIGLILSFLFMTMFSHYLFSFSSSTSATSLEQINARPEIGMLFSWETFLLALFFCFVMNLLSASMPAWKASKVQPAVALSSAR